MSINQRIKIAVDQLEGGVKSAFAEKVGTSATIIGTYMPIDENETDEKKKNRRVSQPGYKELFKILEAYPQLSSDWLMRGVDPMFIDEADVVHPLNNYAFSLQSAIPIYDIEINAGIVNRMIEDNNNAPIVGWYYLKDSPNDGVIGVKTVGDSMYPLITGGDTLLVKRLDVFGFVPFGHPYVIITEKLTVVKYIRKSPNSDSWLLRSYNEQYEDVEIKKGDVVHLFIVVKVLKELT